MTNRTTLRKIASSHVEIVVRGRGGRYIRIPNIVRMRTAFDEPGTYRVSIRGHLPPSRAHEDAILDEDRKSVV